ncbi:MAG: hypothetical protein KDC24_08535 [Saprospiraceae bacterium]|nr:hypothetical protein [Saprospiraceae bacterium]
MRLLNFISIGIIFYMAIFSFGFKGLSSFEEEKAGNTHVQPEPASTKAQAINTLKLHTVTDIKSGIVLGEIPLPSDWDVSKDIWYGPGNTVVQAQEGSEFLDKQRKVIDIDQIIAEDLLPAIKEQGGIPGLITPAPEIASFNKCSFEKMKPETSFRTTFEVKTIEFTVSDNIKGLVIVHFTRYLSPYGNKSNYSLHVLEANPDRFEQSKKDLIFGLSNIRYSDSYIYYYKYRKNPLVQYAIDSWIDNEDDLTRDQPDYEDYWEKAKENWLKYKDLECTKTTELIDTLDYTDDSGWILDDFDYFYDEDKNKVEDYGLPKNDF